MTPTSGPLVPRFDVADPAFAVSSDEVHRARDVIWYARTRFGLAVLRHNLAARLLASDQIDSFAQQQSAGTDPRAVPDTAFGITPTGRPPHFAFGGGAPYCPGHLLAREDIGLALAVLARRLRDPRPAGKAVWQPRSGNTGPARLPVAFIAAS